MDSYSKWQHVMSELDETQDADLVEVATELVNTELESVDSSSWIIGDVLNRVGTGAKMREHFAKNTRYASSTLYSFARTANCFPADIRYEMIAEYPSLTFSMFKECNSLVGNDDYGLDVALKVLMQAGSDMMTVQELKRHIAVEVRGNEQKVTHKLIDSCEAIARNESTGRLSVVSRLILPENVLLEDSVKYRVKIYEITKDVENES